MTGSYLIIILTTVLFLTGLFQLLLTEKQGKKSVLIVKTILIACMIVAFIGSLMQNLQNDRDSRNLQDKATKSLEIIVENKQLTGQLVDLNKTLATKNEEIIALNKKIAKLAQDSISWASGGDNFCYLVFPRPTVKSNTIDLILNNFGNYPVYNVLVKLTNIETRRAALELRIKDKIPPVDSMVDAMQILSIGSRLYQVGTMLPHVSLPLNKLKLPDTGKQSYQIDIWARNGHAVQQLRYQRVSGEWKVAMRTWKRDNSVKEDIDPDFPRNDKREVEW
ncbi:MAG: hypothetical protein GY705_02250 [Bacteroidetes bacterium]|nr:hypothetical protein [Bacteroidota bacterium]